MFVHEYDSTEYATLEECAESLQEFIEVEDIVPHLDLDMTDLLSKFFQRKSDQDFVDWFQRQIEEATALAEDELITEYPDEEEEVE